MPQIIVTADTSSSGGGQAVMFTERVSVQDFESDHFQAQLVERLSWAVGDAHALEQEPERSDDVHADEWGADAAAEEPDAHATREAAAPCTTEAQPLRMFDSPLSRERPRAAVPAS